ncbi:MAG TPA: N-acetylmuramic acid 6-phosphate etherase [Verrucomicrobiae bacterium]|nr:N-acetylmuramic acid 6-phosphate etherase [Verrucomicrobiae bacterium]
MKHLKTEQPNPRSRGLDKKSSFGIVRLINSEDARVARAVRRELPQIARAVDAIAESLGNGGRLLYVGAGTSGRIAFLDAAECPPTFGTPPSLVQAVIAGGEKAMRQAVEGAEDSAQNGAQDLARRKLRARDVVVGIAASGTTPYVLGAMKYSRQVGAKTIGLTSNRASPLARLAQITIAPNTGAEVLAGSTRMKAGTAQKMVLNMLSTGAMVRLGNVYENWMIRVRLTNEKLQKRAARILEQAAGVSASKARHALRQARHDLPVALVMLRTGANSREAQERLAKSQGNVRAAMSGGRPQAGEK